MHKWILVVVCGIVATACSYGTRLADFPPAQHPNGVSVKVTTSRGEMAGELIEMRESGLVFLTFASGKLRLVPYVEIRSAKFEQVGSLVGGGRPPSSQNHQRLRLLSRFPQGMSPDILHKLLQAAGQSELLGAQ